MRQLIVTEFMSLDGVIEAPGPDGSGYKYAGWTFDFSGEDIMKFKADELFASDALLLGRITYEGFAKAWPNMKGTGAFGEKMNDMKKYVVSTTLKKADWNNSEIINQNIAERITQIKQGEGKDILVAGSSKLTQYLMEHNLVDKYQLLVYPVVLGEGKKLFKDGIHQKLKLIESQSFKSGVVLLSYHV